MNINSMLPKAIERTCRIINNIINTKYRMVENTEKKIIHDDIVHVDSGDIANMFNDYFVDIIIYHDFLPTPRRGSHVKSGKTHTHSHQDTPLSPYT